MWFHDDLKDELRDLLRVLLGKTRVYYITDLVWLVIQRMIFGKWVMALESNPAKSACSVGINPESIQWNQLFNRLGAFSDDVEIWTCDRSRHDTNIRYPVLMEFARLVNLRVSEKTRALHCIQSLGLQYHVGQKICYFLDGIDPSGIYLTSIIGSFATVGSYVIYCDEKSLPYPAMATYSDDDIVVWKKKVGAKIGDYVQSASKLPMSVTGNDKSPDPVPVLLREVRYLSREIVIRKGRAMAPLPENTIRNMLMWVRGRGNVDWEEQIKSRCYNALGAALQHPSKFYNEICRAVSLTCTTYKINVPIVPYDEAQRDLFKRHYE
jgi:hypothetical protein